VEERISTLRRGLLLTLFIQAVFDNDTDIMFLLAFLRVQLMIEGTVILIYVAIGGIALEVIGTGSGHDADIGRCDEARIGKEKQRNGSSCITEHWWDVEGLGSIRHSEADPGLLLVKGPPGRRGDGYE
jgi:hypothetical protein